MYYFNARWYDQELGRFISEDPAADPNNPNLYVYCANNPLVYIDPTGQWNEESKWWNPLTWFNKSDDGGNGGGKPEGSSGSQNSGGNTPKPPNPPSVPDQKSSIVAPSDEFSHVDVDRIEEVYKQLRQQYPNIGDVSHENLTEHAKNNGLNDAERLYLCYRVTHDNPNFNAGYKGDPPKDLPNEDPTWCNAYISYSYYLFTGSTELMGEGADPAKHNNFVDPTSGWTIGVSKQMKVMEEGWVKVDTPEEAQAYANQGKFVVGIEPSHVAGVSPGSGLTHQANKLFFPSVAQQGRNRYLYGQTEREYMNWSWTVKSYKSVVFYVKK